jgi:hypothetical protein
VNSQTEHNKENQTNNKQEPKQAGNNAKSLIELVTGSSERNTL